MVLKITKVPKIDNIEKIIIKEEFIKIIKIIALWAILDFFWAKKYHKPTNL
jgi:hypothetical protein